MSPHRLTTEITEEHARHLEKMTGNKGAYASSSDYVNALIQDDIDRQEATALREHIREGYEDIKAGRFFEGTGNFHDDLKKYEQIKGEWGERG